MREALLKSAPNIPCEPEDAYALLLLNNQVEIGDKNEVVVFIKRAFKEGQHVADETKKEIEKFAKTPFQSVVDAPDNIIREGGKGLENLGKAIGDAGQAVGNAGKAIGNATGVCGEKCAFGKCVNIAELAVSPLSRVPFVSLVASNDRIQGRTVQRRRECQSIPPER